MQENPSRQYPTRKAPWVFTQELQDLLFAHWPVAPGALRHLVPSDFSLDTYGGAAWISVVSYWMSARPRLLPHLPGLSAFPGLNVRTYVTREDKPGVYFLSIDAARPLAVEGAKRVFSLPYYTARMYAAWEDGWFYYKSERTQKGAPSAQLSLRYRPVGQARPLQRGSLEDFLTSRYCLYTVDPKGQPYRQEIDHPVWELAPTQAQFQVNTMLSALGVTVGGPPILQFSKHQEIATWLPERVY